MKSQSSEQFVRPDLRAHIYSDALLNNVKQLKSLCAPGVRFCAVVKSNAYGHGINEVVGILKNADVDFFAVAGIFEALHIAPLVGTQSILILQPIHSAMEPEQIILCAKNHFHCAVTSADAAKYASLVLTGTGYTLDLHINIETGMRRSGLEPQPAQKLIRRIDETQNLNLAGLYTHFATADEDDLSFAHEQLAVFNDFLTRTALRSREHVLIHAANSAAAIKMPQSHFDMVRCGIAMYGYFSRRRPDPPIDLVPAMKLCAPIVQLRKIPKGKSVSYGRSFVTTHDTVAAVVPVGYADGYRRCFSNSAKAKFEQAYLPVIGRVCMDQLLIDVTDVPAASVGRLVTVIDNSHDSPCSAYALADLAGTICYEILAGLPTHIDRIVH